MNLQELVAAKVVETQSKLARCGYPKIDIASMVTDIRGTVAGRAYTWDKRIEINVKYLREHQAEVLAETVPHEVCHIYVSQYHRFAKQAHGPEFRTMMRRIGCTGNTKHTMQLSGTPSKVRKNRVLRYVYVTTAGKHINLTRAQHAKMVASNNTAFRAKSGHSLVFTGRSNYI